MPWGVAWLMKKSRASFWASASQVTTLMPRSRAFRSTVEIATSFSTLTAMTSTPRVIQASTTSFCLAGSRSVGPSQRSSTPASWAASSAPLRQLMKYGSPFAFGIMATTGLCAGRAAGAGAAPRALRPAPRSSSRSERTDQPVPADHQERRARMTALRATTCEFFTSSSPGAA